MSIMNIGIDLAKNIFAVHGVDENGKAVLIKPSSEKGAWLTFQAAFVPQGSHLRLVV